MLALDPSTLSPQAQRIALPTAPLKVQEVAARGMMPGLKPDEVLAVLVVLQDSDRPTVRDVARATLTKPPGPLLAGALAGDLAPQAIDALAHALLEDAGVVEKLLAMPRIAPETVEMLAARGSEAVTELVATNESRLLEHPTIIERLYMNDKTRMSTADRLIELAVRHKVELQGIGAWREASAAIVGELIFDPTPEPSPDDALFSDAYAVAQQLANQLAIAEDEDTHTETEDGQEALREAMLPLYQRIAKMTTTQKIRTAMIGSREARMLLVRDNNRLVSAAAVRSPMMSESEAALISRNRNVPDEVLRIIGSTPEWLKSYAVKRNLVENPRTPPMLSTRLIIHLRESDLRGLAKSKNVTSPVRDAARRQLERRKH